jgi:hypothetical protein
MFIELNSVLHLSSEERGLDLEVRLVLRVTVPGEAGVSVVIGLPPDLSIANLGDEDTVRRHLSDAIHAGLAQSSIELSPTGIMVEVRELRAKPRSLDEDARVLLPVLRSVATLVTWSVAGLWESIDGLGGRST